LCGEQDVDGVRQRRGGSKSRLLNHVAHQIKFSGFSNKVNYVDICKNLTAPPEPEKWCCPPNILFYFIITKFQKDFNFYSDFFVYVNYIAH
jgi:hypothetical protein